MPNCAHSLHVFVCLGWGENVEWLTVWKELKGWKNEENVPQHRAAYATPLACSQTNPSRAKYLAMGHAAIMQASVHNEK
jgi:hypothetical protein